MNQPPDTKGDLVDFLRANVNLSAVSADMTTDDIDHPDLEGGRSTPGVRVHSPTTSLPGAGSAGYSGMAPGKGGVKEVRTTLQVDCWGGSESDASDGTITKHPDEVAAELKGEVWAAVEWNDAPPEYRFFSVQDDMDGNDPDADPPEYRQIVFVGMYYDIRPPG